MHNSILHLERNRPGSTKATECNIASKQSNYSKNLESHAWLSSDSTVRTHISTSQHTGRSNTADVVFYIAGFNFAQKIVWVETLMIWNDGHGLRRKWSSNDLSSACVILTGLSSFEEVLQCLVNQTHARIWFDRIFSIMFSPLYRMTQLPIA